MAETGDRESRAQRLQKAKLIGAEPLRIVTVEDADAAVLREPAKPVRHVNRRVRALLDRMVVTMYQAEGVGLAAPQVGERLRAFVVDTGEGEGLHHFINPQIVEREGEAYAYEGCLSIPGWMGDVPRATRIRVHATDYDGREFWFDAEGFLARAIQHETDHLDGVLFTARARKVVEVDAETRLRIVYLGSPGFARDVLGHLLEADVAPVAVVTRGDKPRGRGNHPLPTPVKQLALDNEIPVLHLPDADALRAYEPDVLLTVAYGRILKPSVLDLARLAAVNLHPSLLPHYRGPAPILRALWNADPAATTPTGVTTMHMSDEVDAGDIILQAEVPIEPEDDRAALEQRLAERGAALVRRTLRLLARDEAPRTPQDHARATYAPMLAPEEESLDWHRPTAHVLGQIRALSPSPGATARFRDQPLKLLRAQPYPASGSPGSLLAVEPGRGLVVATGDGAVLITQLQPAGRRRQSATEFANGHRPRPGETL